MYKNLITLAVILVAGKAIAKESEVMFPLSTKNPERLRLVQTRAVADVGIQIATAIRELPITGGMVSAGLSGEQMILADPFVGVTKPVTVRLGAGTIAVNTNVTVPRNIVLRFDDGTFLSIASGFTLTIEGSIVAPMGKIFEGPGTVKMSAVTTVRPQWWGALADGSNDDGTPILSAINALEKKGGEIAFEGSYRITKRINIAVSNLTLSFRRGARLVFDPSSPISPANDRALAIVGPVSNQRNIVGAIRSGTKTFRAVDAKDTADLAPGDWLVIQEVDKRQAEVYYYESVQVQTVRNGLVTIRGKFRTTFPGTHSTVTFTKLLRPVENVTLQGMTLESRYKPSGVVGITIGEGTHHTFIENSTINMTEGAAITTYLTSDITITHNTFRNGPNGSSEFSALTDAKITENVFDFYESTPATSALTLDFGAGFFLFEKNTIVKAGNIAMQVSYGVHDGVIHDNNFGWVRDAGIGVGQGISGTGSYNNVVAGNVLAGGDEGKGNTGIAFTTDVQASPNVPSTKNRIVGNTVRNFKNPYYIEKPNR